MTKRKYLTRDEVTSLLNAASHGRHGIRNHCMILMAFRHGFRISELLSLKLTDINLQSRQVFIRRSKNGFSTTHPIGETEFSAIMKWLDTRKSYGSAAGSNRVFLTERHPSLSRKQAWVIIRNCGIQAEIDIHSHPHMLRHACGYTLANEGADTRLIQDYLGHKNIRHTVHYTKSNSARFSDFLRII